MAAAGGIAAMIAWDLIVALVAKRRPVPLIVYAIGMIVAATIAAFLLTGVTNAISMLAGASVAIGFLAAVGVTIIWQLTHDEPEGATRVATRVVRGIVVRGLAFSALTIVVSLIVRLFRHG